MSRDERLATLIQRTLRETLETRSQDPAAVDRVGAAVGAALGQEPDSEDPKAALRGDEAQASPDERTRGER